MWSLQLAVKPPGHNLIHVDKWFLKMYHTCVFAGIAIYSHSDHETNITIESTLKNGSQRCITLVFARLATYGHSDHKTDITIEFTSKNGSRKCITLVCLLDLPYMVTLITKPTSPLNSYQKIMMRTPWGLHRDSTRTPQDFEGIIRTFEQVMQSP